MTTPAQLQHLATRMGLTAVLDASGGYDVVRVIVSRDGVESVFDPEYNAVKSQELMCWLLKQKPIHFYDGDHRTSWFEFSDGGIFKMVYAEGEHLSVQSWQHDNTPPSLRAAILAAALRVAGET